MLARLLPSRGDVFGGLSAGVVALPLCLALGALSGLGPEAGLYGAIAGGILASIFGGTRTAITGPTTPMTLFAILIVAGTRLPDGQVDLAKVLAIFALAGVMQMAFGMLRFGNYIRYVPYPVISGFMSGIGVIIILQQLFPMAGMAAPSSNPWTIVGNLHLLPVGVLWEVAALAAGTLAIVLMLPRFTKAVPAPLVALLLVPIGAMIFSIDAPRIGTIPAGLPSLVMPRLDLSEIGFILSSAAQLALLGSVDSLLGSLLADSLTKTRHDSNRELIGQGIGNIGAALVGGLPGACANIRTIVNIKSGGESRASGVIHGIFLLAVLLGLSGLVEHIPFAVLSGILVGAGIGCIDYRGFSLLLRAPRSDAAIMILVLVLTVFSGLITAVAVGLVVACFIFMKKAADLSGDRTTLSSMADQHWAKDFDIPAEQRDRFLVAHIEGPLFFGFARGFADISEQAASAQLLVLGMERVAFIDQSGAYALHDALIVLHQEGVRVVIVGLPLGQRDILEAIHVIPDLVRPEEVFEDFTALRQVMPKFISGTAGTS